MPGGREKFDCDVSTVFDASIEVVEELGWDVRNMDKEGLSLKAITPISLRSYRDVISVKIHEEDTGTTVLVTSNAKFQLVDWGQGDKNVEKFLEKLSDELNTK